MYHYLISLELIVTSENKNPSYESVARKLSTLSCQENLDHYELRTQLVKDKRNYLYKKLGIDHLNIKYFNGIDIQEYVLEKDETVYNEYLLEDLLEQFEEESWDRKFKVKSFVLENQKRL
jgi:hypothetical protein